MGQISSQGFHHLFAAVSHVCFLCVVIAGEGGQSDSVLGASSKTLHSLDHHHVGRQEDDRGIC